MQKYTGTKQMALAKLISKSNNSSTKKPKKRPATMLFGLCVKSKVNVDLVPGKLYRILPDSKADSEGYVRVVDDSGESYLYPASYFCRLRLSSTIGRKLTRFV